MGMKTLSEIEHGSGRSLCYGCRYWDWSVLLGAAPGCWEHECHSPIEHLKPGDCVIACEGYACETSPPAEGPA